MFNYKATLQAMRDERDSMQAELNKLGQAIAALQALVPDAMPARTTTKLSARGQISQAQKRRWAKVKQAQNSNVTTAKKPKRKISPQGLRNIIEAQKKRWAKVKAASQTKTKSTAGKKASQASATK